MEILTEADFIACLLICNVVCGMLSQAAQVLERCANEDSGRPMKITSNTSLLKTVG